MCPGSKQWSWGSEPTSAFPQAEFLTREPAVAKERRCQYFTWDGGPGTAGCPLSAALQRLE